MGRKLCDLTSERFGRLVAVEPAGRVRGGRPLWLCKCDCGGSVCATNGELRSGRRTGCLSCLDDRRSVPRAKGEESRNFKHGGASRGARTKEYRAWESMIRRCTMPSQRGYKNYGGRGIKVCAEWGADFPAFLSHVGLAPSKSHTIDRINVNGNYEPGNVRWATRKEQGVNKRSSALVTHDGRTMSVSEWAELVGVKYQTLWARLFVNDWPVDRALSP